MKYVSHFLNQPVYFKNKRQGILLLLNNRDLMGEHVNGKIYNAAAFITGAGIVAATIILLVLTIIGKA